MVVSVSGVFGRGCTWKAFHEPGEVFGDYCHASSVLHLRYHFSDQRIVNVCYSSPEANDGHDACGVSLEMRDVSIWTVE
jgi:hypothetical protein